VYGILIISVFTVLYSLTSVAHAEENQLLELLDILKDKGAITDKEYEQLKTPSSQAGSHGTDSKDVMVSTGGGIAVQPNDGAFSAQIGGRLMIDMPIIRKTRFHWVRGQNYAVHDWTSKAQCMRTGVMN